MSEEMSKTKDELSTNKFVLRLLRIILFFPLAVVFLSVVFVLCLVVGFLGGMKEGAEGFGEILKEFLQ